MSFKAKIDFCGLADGTHIMLASHDEGRASSNTICANDEGDVADVTKFGVTMSPSNIYKLKADLTSYNIVLGSVNTVNLGTQQAPDNHYFVLKSVAIGTSNSGAVSISAQAEEVPSATAARTYTVSIASLKCRIKAQIINSLFTLGGEKVHLQSASYTFSVDFTPTTIDGVRVTYDIHGGKIECSLSAKQAGTVAPTVTATAADTEVKIISGEPTESRPDSDYATVTAAVTKYLTADVAASDSEASS
jgi:hypothetical protein